MKKTGSGIWLHSTNDETRIDKGLDSKPKKELMIAQELDALIYFYCMK